MDSKGLPITYSLFKGNTNDVKTLNPMASEIAREHGYLKTIIVADKGVHSASNITFNKAIGRGYIFSQKVRGAHKELKEFILDQNGYRGNDIFKLKERVFPREITVQDYDTSKTRKMRIDEKQIVYYSKKYADRQKHKREEQLKKAYDLIADPTKYDKSNSTGFKKYIKNIRFNKKTGEVVKSKVRLFIDEDKIKEEALWDGYYSIVTSQLDMPTSQVIQKYRFLWKIEETFKITKSPLRARPVFHSRDDRIQSHFLICYIALVILRLLQLELDNEYSIPKIIDSIQKCEVSHIEQNIYLCNYSDDLIKKFADKFNIPFGKKYLTKLMIKKILSHNN